MKVVSKYDEFELREKLFRRMMDSSDLLRLAIKDTEVYVKLQKEMEECLDTYREFLKARVFKKGLTAAFGADLYNEAVA